MVVQELNMKGGGGGGLGDFINQLRGTFKGIYWHGVEQKEMYGFRVENK